MRSNRFNDIGGNVIGGLIIVAGTLAIVSVFSWVIYICWEAILS